MGFMLYRQKRQCNENKTVGENDTVLPTDCPHSVGFLAGFCWTESHSPCYSPGLGEP